LDSTHAPTVSCHHALTNQIAAAIAVVVAAVAVRITVAAVAVRITVSADQP
jgi:hypothetical protein